MLCRDNENYFGTEVPMGLNPASVNKLAFTPRESLGVVAALAHLITLNLIVHQVGPAVAAGCSG